MMPTRQGSIRLFRFAGIDAYLHWSWFVAALFLFRSPIGHYSTPIWGAFEYLALFLIVLMHEFGHALACRQVGGQANQIVLWPLGGVAYVSPPQRPGAMLWSIAAGPLVNVALMPVLCIFFVLSRQMGWAESLPNVDALLVALLKINTGLLVFNLFPIYPLDGGQILRSLLWFAVGRGPSLMAASIIGFVGVAVLALLALLARDPWLVIITVFISLNCLGGLLQARQLARAESAPRHGGFACPACNAAPAAGPFWGCPKCRVRFDTFETLATCPKCGMQFGVTQCLECGAASPIRQWLLRDDLPPKLPPGL